MKEDLRLIAEELNWKVILSIGAIGNIAIMILALITL